MDFGSKLKKIRQENGLSQELMAGLLFTTQGNYSQYESNQRTPSIDLLKRLIEKFNLDANWLLLPTNDQTNNDQLKNSDSIKINNQYPLSQETLGEIVKKIDEILSKL